MLVRRSTVTGPLDSRQVSRDVGSPPAPGGKRNAAPSTVTGTVFPATTSVSLPATRRQSRRLHAEICAGLDVLEIGSPENVSCWVGISARSVT